MAPPNAITAVQMIPMTTFKTIESVVAGAGLRVVVVISWEVVVVIVEVVVGVALVVVGVVVAVVVVEL